LDEIVVESKRVNKNTVKSYLHVPDRIKKYVKTHELFVIYNEEIPDNESILNISLVSNVLPLAWISDCDIRVDSLDKRYRESMYALKEEMNKIFPIKQYKTDINAGRIVENKVEAEGTGLLFSGGVDSTYSLISNWSKKPHLLMVWGIDMHPYPEYAEHWNQLDSIYTEFAKRNDLEFNMIKTNISQILNYPRIDHDFHRVLHSSRIRMKHQYALFPISMAAPFSINRFNELLFAASNHPEFKIYRTSSTSFPLTDEKIVWADLDTKHDGFIPRIDKLYSIKDFIKKQDIVLKVCFRPELNCCSCAECLRTIMYFAVQGIDPNRVGYKVNEDTFDYMRKFYESFSTSETAIKTYYEPIRRMIPEKIDQVFEGSRPFFEWFFEKDLTSNYRDYWSYRVIYNWLPFSLASIYDRVLSKTRIDIHPEGFDVSHFPEVKNHKYGYE
jgi:hypothetical protein